MYFGIVIRGLSTCHNKDDNIDAYLLITIDVITLENKHR